MAMTNVKQIVSNWIKKNYNDYTAIKEDTLSIRICTCDKNSAADASIDTLEVYQLEADDVRFNYWGSKVLPKNETPISICTADTIRCVRSRRLLRVLSNSGSTGILINRRALPRVTALKNLAESKSLKR